MAANTKRTPAAFDPAAFESFRFLARELDAHGHVTLRYALDDEISFVEELDLPVEGGVGEADRERVDGLLALLHWVAGVSYFKTALPPSISCETGAPPPAVAALLQALYSEGLGELAYTNELAELPRPRFPSAPAAGAAPASPAASGRARQGARAAHERAADLGQHARVLVPIGGGK